MSTDDQNVAAVEVDETYNASGRDDSSYDSSTGGSSTTSVGSSVFSFTYENGRRYHSDRFSKAEYYMPNDEKEQDRLDLYHHIFLTMNKGKLYNAPLDHPQKVLDIGTGTGIWAIDFADEHPEAEIIATDISPIQPSWVPPNLKFEVDDAAEAWTFGENTFDFIHLRNMGGSFQDWDHTINQCKVHLKPGAWVEIQDYDCEIHTHKGVNLNARPDQTAENTPPLAYFCEEVSRCSEKIGRPIRVIQTMKERLEKAGFINVQCHKTIWPFGDWPKDKELRELGMYCRQGVIDGIDGFGMQLLTRVAGYSQQEVIEFAKKVHKDVGKSGGKYFAHGYFVYGQRPEDD